MNSFQFIGAYDRRTSVGTIAASEAHQMVKSTALKISQPRKPKTRTIAEILRRAEQMGVYAEHIGREIYFTPDPKGKSAEYIRTTQKYAWQVLDNIAAEILASKSDEQAIADGIAAKELII